MIDGEFKSPEKFRAVQRRFFSHDWVRGTDLEGWIDGLTRPAIRVVTASGQTVLVSPRIQDQFTLKQLSFMLDQVEDMKIDEPHSGMGPDYVVREFDSGRRSFGRTACVETREGDDLFYASLGGQNWGRFVRGRKPEPCSWLTVILRKMGGAYEVRAAYVGRKNPAWPGDPNERGDESRKFWKNHALLDGTLPYLEGTVTRKAPWWFKKDGVREDRIRRGVAPHHSAVVDRG
jgi:hypothetical protein